MRLSSVFARPEEPGSPRLTPTCRMTRPTSFGSGKHCPATMVHWGGDTTRQDVVSKRVISHWANRVRNTVLGQAIRDTGCSVRIFSRDMALRLPIFHGMHRFIGPLLLREGCQLDPGAGQSSASPERLLALQSLESIARRDRRPSGCQLAPAQAGALSSDQAVAVSGRDIRIELG